jgi:hypothetical protein
VAVGTGVSGEQVEQGGCELTNELVQWYVVGCSGKRGGGGGSCDSMSGGH